MPPSGLGRGSKVIRVSIQSVGPLTHRQTILFRAALDDFEDGGGLTEVAEVNGQLPADRVFTGDRMACPPLLDPSPRGCELVHALRRRVDREAMQDVWHFVSFLVGWLV